MASNRRSSSTLLAHITLLATHVSVVAHAVARTARILLAHALSLTCRRMIHRYTVAVLQQLWAPAYYFALLLAASRHYHQLDAAVAWCCSRQSPHYKHRQRLWWHVVHVLLRTHSAVIF